MYWETTWRRSELQLLSVFIVVVVLALGVVVVVIVVVVVFVGDGRDSISHLPRSVWMEAEMATPSTPLVSPSPFRVGHFLFATASDDVTCVCGAAFVGEEEEEEEEA